MLRRENFKIDEYKIRVDEGSYLVEVENSDDPEMSGDVNSLPAWVFQSRYAIWLTVGEAPIRIRAMQGEQIKQQLLRRFPQIIPA